MTATVDASLRQSREATVLAHLDAEKHRDLEATLATFKVGAARLELPGGEVADGPAEVADTYRALFHAFPDLSIPDLELGSLWHHGDLVIGETRLQGTHTGTFRGLPPTGRRIDMPLVAIFEFDGPDLLCERVYWDRLTLFIQLGVARDPNTRAGKLTTLLSHPVTLARATIRARGTGADRPVSRRLLQPFVVVDALTEDEAAARATLRK
jgi:predicted ester cyclase